MPNELELDDVRRRLESFRTALTAGSHAGLEDRVEQSLGPCQRALACLVEGARRYPLPPGAREGCLEIRRLAGVILELVRHAEQVRVGLAGIASLQYSADGAPRLEAGSRLLAEV
jgi:hypothetical protein